MDSQYKPLNQSDELPYWPMYGTELTHEMTGPEVRMPLGAPIPPELFENIIFYVNANRASPLPFHERSLESSLRRIPGKPALQDRLNDLKNCALVCRFWANKCRQHMFADRNLKIDRHEDAILFRRYTVRGCASLTPMHQLVHRISVCQNYESRSSFLHLLYLPVIQDKLSSVEINGPVPAKFPPLQLDTPNWGLPPSVILPCSFLRSDIRISKVHLPSFYYVTKYIKHFAFAAWISFDEVTWNGRTPLLLPHASSTITRRPKPHSMDIWASGCTKNAMLALTSAMLNPQCPMHRLSDEERVWMVTFMTSLSSDKKHPWVRIQFKISEYTTTMRVHPFHFVFQEAPSTTLLSYALRVVGIHTYINQYSFDRVNLLANFDALVNHARARSTIRVLVLLFDSFDRLRESMKSVIHVFDPTSEPFKFVIAYMANVEDRAVGVDLVTLEPNGHNWADLSQGGESWSEVILLRELKKSH